MLVCDVNEDVVSLAAGVVNKLLRYNPNLDPYDIGRKYIIHSYTITAQL